MLRKKRPLIAAFTQVDKEGSGYVPKDRWCKVMENVSSTSFLNFVVCICECVCVWIVFADNKYYVVYFFLLEGPLYVELSTVCVYFSLLFFPAYVE